MPTIVFCSCLLIQPQSRCGYGWQAKQKRRLATQDVPSEGAKEDMRYTPPMQASHTQQHLWNKEHRNPKMLLPMDGEIPSTSLPFFLPWINNFQGKRGVEMGCGKGRNCIALAKEGVHMTGFDFSEVAIAEAKKRAKKRGLSEGDTMFLTQDARMPWPFPDASFDLGLDCFATTDIESEEGRIFVREEFRRILKPEGLLFIATISSESPFHKEKLLRANSPGGAGFLLEKVYGESELKTFYGERFAVLALERKKKHRSLTFDGVAHDTEDFWLVCKKK